MVLGLGLFHKNVSGSRCYENKFQISQPSYYLHLLFGQHKPTVCRYVHLTRDAAIMPYQQEEYRKLTGVDESCRDR
jgi:hypothetical protein